MPGIVEFPEPVHDALERYGDFFANECHRRHFAGGLDGLIVAAGDAGPGNRASY